MHMMRLLMGIDLNKLFSILHQRGKTGHVVINGYASDILIEDGKYCLLDLKGNDGLYEEYKKETGQENET